jgi:hypothetical protein
MVRQENNSNAIWGGPGGQGDPNAAITSEMEQLSQMAQQFMQEQFSWGQGQFAKNSQLTDQVVGDMMNLYSQLSGAGNTLMVAYEQYFMPEYSKLVTDANNYASQARIQQAMGAAESGTAQAFNGQRNAALADLQSFGIDPSSGRYAQLDAAERTQQAAAQAGAGFQAEQATEATGRALRSEALQLGSVMPSQATAAYNAAGQAATAGENARLANSQEGVNMMGSPVQWGGVAKMGYPPRTGMATSSKGPGSPGSRPSPSDPYGTGRDNGSQARGPGGSTTSTTSSKPYDPTGLGGAGGGQQAPWTPYGQGSNQGALPGNQPDSGGLPGDFGGLPMDVWTQPGGGTIPDTQGGSPWTPDNSTNTDWSSAQPSQYTDTSNMDFTPTDQGTSAGGANDFSAGDQTEMAEGGAIPMSRSPSRGRRTDDIPAKVNDTGEDIRVNAGEFIMPRQTVQWYGHKFFQDLIKKSKAGRQGAPGKPTMRPPLNLGGAIPMGGYHG